MASSSIPFTNLETPKTLHLPTNSPPTGVGYIPPSSDNKIAGLQEQIKDVSNIMMTNIEKTLKRGENLEILTTRAENLEESSVLFKKSSTSLRCQLWKQSMCLYGIIGCLTLFLLTIIAIVIYVLVKKLD